MIRGISDMAPVGPPHDGPCFRLPIAPRQTTPGTRGRRRCRAGARGSPGWRRAGPQEGGGILAWRGQVADPQTIEVANPYRGSYRWQDDAPQPPAWPIRDSYRRVTWRELEPTQGNYDFSRIDEGIATARANGGVFGFRVQAACTGCAAGGVAVPDYLKDLMPKGFWFRLNNTTNYAPDWNDPDYLSRLDALLHALGQRYGNDPRVGFVDISSYGDYGEWHLHQWPYPSATGATPITTANAEAIVDMNVRAFPSKWLLMQHQTITADGENEHNVFLYALNKYPRIGIRNDCLGDSWFTDEMGRLSKAYPVVANRWKTAPVMTEYCYQSPGSGGFERASGQIAQFHVGNIGNGNMAPLRSFSVGEQRQWELNNAHSGYRFVPDHLAMAISTLGRQSVRARVELVERRRHTGVQPMGGHAAASERERSDRVERDVEARPRTFPAGDTVDNGHLHTWSRRARAVPSCARRARPEALLRPTRAGGCASRLRRQLSDRISRGAARRRQGVSSTPAGPRHATGDLRQMRSMDDRIQGPC